MGSYSEQNVNSGILDKKKNAFKEEELNIGELIETLMKNANLELNQDVFKKIKYMCRLSPNNISHVFYLLMTQLQKEHAEIRYIALIAINELFIRSYKFRKLLERNLEEFLELTLETNPKKELPPPKAVAQRLKCQAQHFIKLWHHKFGSTCKRLDVAYSFLKKCKNVNLDAHQQLLAADDVSRQQQQESVHHERSVLKKICVAKKEMEDMEPEISALLTEIENCFQLVIPLPNDLFTSSDFSEFGSSKASDTLFNSNVESLNSVSCSPFSNISDDKYPENSGKGFQVSLRQHGISDIKSNLNIEVNKISSIVVEENEDTVPVLENLKGLYKQITLKYLPAVMKWSKVFTQGDNCLDHLKKAIDIKLLLEAKIAKFKKLNFVSKAPFIDETSHSTEIDDSDNEFEEVQEKEGFEDFAISEKSFSSSNDVNNDSIHTSQLSNYGYKDMDQNSSKLDLNQNLRKDDRSALTKRIINPLDQPSTSSTSDWQDPELLEDIEAATGINLKMPAKKKTKSKVSKKKDVSKKSLRTDIKASKNTTYNRLYKKVFKKCHS